ncbi:MAG TPA: membrane protein insertase YidC, partial [Burkholderiales bacterium]|nr:membrane protein insertase YidC [Burkholderiales bacterium]
MDNKRLVVFIIFSLSVLLIWQKWESAHTPPPQAQTKPAASLPSPDAKLTEKPVSAGPVDTGAELLRGNTIHVKTDVMDVGISTIGGDLRSLDLLKYHDSRDPGKPYSFFHSGGGRTYVAQSGLIGNELPSHRTPFTASSFDYALKPGEDTLQVRLEGPENSGYKVEKTYTFHRGSYVIDVSYDIKNLGNSA